MGMRRMLAVDLAAGSDSTAFLTRQIDPPYRISAYGGFTGNVTIQHSPDKGSTWIDVGTITSGSDISVTDPVERFRVEGTHTGSAATVVLFSDSSGARTLG